MALNSWKPLQVVLKNTHFSEYLLHKLIKTDSSFSHCHKKIGNIIYINEVLFEDWLQQTDCDDVANA